MTSASMFDDDLDSRLIAVPLPAGLLTRLRKLPLADDADLDEILTDVDIPVGFNQRLFRAPRLVRGRRLSRWPGQAAAAILIFTMGMAYSLAAVAFVAPRFEQHAQGDHSRLAFTSETERFDPLIQQTLSEHLDLDMPLSAAELCLVDEQKLMRHIHGPQASNLGHQPPSEELIAMAFRPNEREFWRDATALDYLTSRSVNRAELHFTNSGAVDLRFWRRTGLLPWMDTASNRSIAAPLVFDDTSYRLARQEIGAGRLPAEADIRVEEFLAAIDYGLPSEQAATAALLLVAGPSPFEAPMDDMLRGRDAPTRWLLMIAAVPPAIEETLNAPPRLTVEFSAVRVSRYRVLGYAPPNSGGPHSEVGPTSDDPGAPPLLSGKAAVVLCEMETSETEHPDLEPVRVRLADMPEHALRREGAVRGNSAVLEPQMFYRDFASAPTVWRQAALVALAAELLAGSPFAQGASLTEVAALARQLEPSVSDQIGWRDFIETVSQAQSLRSSLRRAF